MKKIATETYKTKVARFLQEDELRGKGQSAIEIAISGTNLPHNVKEALLTATHECKDPYCRTYLFAIPDALEQYGEEGLKPQLHYIYANMEEYPNEEVKNTIADFLQIPPEDRHEQPGEKPEYSPEL